MRDLPSAVDIAVIGAGAAGIAAARCLREAAMASMVVLEARDRVGGRVHTIAPAGFPLGRSQPALADRPASRFLGPSTAAGVDDTAAPQR
jgi:monoamine oxidase